VILAAAFNLTPKAVSGGPEWVDSDRYDFLAEAPGRVRPDTEEQMTMLRKLLVDRFSLKFHREPKEFSIYALTVAKGGAKLHRWFSCSRRVGRGLRRATRAWARWRG
jgi:uncharacterized protein (TIGR03435 family)